MSKTGRHAFRPSIAWKWKWLSIEIWVCILRSWINTALISFLQPCQRLLPQLCCCVRLLVLSLPFCLDLFVDFGSFVFYLSSIDFQSFQNFLQFPKKLTLQLKITAAIKLHWSFSSDFHIWIITSRFSLSMGPHHDSCKSQPIVL